MLGDDRRAMLGTLENAPRLGIWEWTPATDQMVWSDGLYELLELAPGEVPTMNGLLAKLHPADRSSFETHLSRARRERGLLAFRCRSDAQRILQVRMQRTLADDGSLRSIVGTNQDITDETLAADPSAAIAALTGAIANEIGSPLAVIAAALHGLPHTPPIGDALRAVDRIRYILGDLDLYARGDHSAGQAIQLEEVVVLACAQLESLPARATIVRRLEPTIPVRANATVMSRVFVELLENALDAVATVPIKNVSITTRNDGREWSVVEITDSGIGMSPPVQARIYEPFFTTKGVGRRGLGLSICRGIVDSLGGSITIHSREHEGTRVVLALPTSPPRPRVVSSELSPVPSRTRGRVLIVDDEILFAKALSRLLSHEHDVVMVANGQLALHEIQRGARFDVILCDLMMPVMTGAELRAELLEAHPDQAGRMIFITGGTLDGQSEALLGQVESFEKPCDVAQLREAVRRRIAASRTDS